MFTGVVVLLMQHCDMSCRVVSCRAVLCCVFWCCVVLRCVVLYCVVLCFVVLCCVVLYCAVLCCTVLCCIVLCCAVLCCPLCCVVFRYGDLSLTPPPNAVTECFHLLESMEPEVKSSKKTTVVVVSKKRRETGTTAFIVSPVIKTRVMFTRSMVKRSCACVCLPVLNCVLCDKDEHKKLSELLARFSDRIMKNEITCKTGGAFCSVTRGITERVLNDVV